MQVSAYAHALPKEPIRLDPPQYTPFTLQQLANFDGVRGPRMFVSIKGVIFDVTRNSPSYAPGRGYHLFVGRDASRALAKASLNIEDAVPYYADLSPAELQSLDDWFHYFSIRYNIVGRLV